MESKRIEAGRTERITVRFGALRIVWSDRKCALGRSVTNKAPRYRSKTRLLLNDESTYQNVEDDVSELCALFGLTENVL